MRVVFLDPLEARLRDFPAQYLPSPDFEVSQADTAGRFPDGWESAEAAVWSETPLNRDLIEQMPNLKFLQRIGWFRARGDASIALERGIPVAVTPNGVADRVAQHAFTLTLMLLRRMRAAIEAILVGANPQELEERDADTGQNTVNWAHIDGIANLNHETVGILGFGEIGSAYARMLAPFNTRTLAYRRRPLSAEQEAFYQA
ncbi:MAG TPA: NAD(P)-dependent oxidoreductase, partial [Dehalococcoidia bacterium]|nr:NAD(P)-dependent oxidoreductase [Dehalococcoidia bacterium]